MGTADGQDPDLARGPDRTRSPLGGGAVRRARWWHRGPFVNRQVRVSVGVLLAFLFVFYVALPLLASHRSEVATLGHIHVQYLILGVILEIGALTAYTQLTHAVLPPGGPRRLRLFRINLSTLALSHVSPGGTAPGAALGYRLLTQSGVSGADTGFALGTQGIGSAVVLNVLFWLGLVAFLIIHGFHPPTSHRGGQSMSGSVLVIVAAAVGVVLVGAFGAAFMLLSRGQDHTQELVRRLAVKLRLRNPDRVAALTRRMAERFALLVDDRPLLYRAMGWATANWLLDAASLWVFVAAFSHFISPVDLIVAYGLANILAAIPITPGGLGVVEFVLVSMITGFGPTAGEALSGVLAYRAVNFWLPIPFGGLAYASLQLERGGLYRRLHLFFLARYQRRRTDGPVDELVDGSVDGSSNGSLHDPKARPMVGPAAGAGPSPTGAQATPLSPTTGASRSELADAVTVDQANDLSTTPTGATTGGSESSPVRLTRFGRGRRPVAPPRPAP